MTIESANTITKELRELDERVEVTGIDATGTSWCRRPRLWWTSFHGAKMEEEHEDRRHGIRHHHVHDELEPLENILEGNYALRCIGQNVRRFHTFTRCRPATQEPDMPTGKATASPGALSRWASDAWRYSPYQFEGDMLVWSAKGAGQEWRCLKGNERIRMLHFPANYFDSVNPTGDERASLAGDPFSVMVFSRLTHACGLGVWPPAETWMENDRVVTSNGESEVKVQPHDVAPIGEERGKIKLEGRQAVPEKTAARLRATLPNAVNEKPDTHTGPYGIVKIKSTESNDTSWMVRGYRTPRKMLPAIREPPFLNMEAFDGILVTVVTEDDQTQVIKPPEGTELIYIWMLSGRESLQWEKDSFVCKAASAS